jgi:predicted TIM-barrel fold metal-dependent hydrolase
MADLAIDVDAIVAIDVHTHTHAHMDHRPPDQVTVEFLDAAEKYFGGKPPQPTTQDVADYYRERKMAAVVFTVDSPYGTGEHTVSTDEVIEVAAANPDVLIPFASVDPHKGKAGVREAREYIERGVRGFKFHPNTQGFHPNDRMAYPLYEVIAEHGLIALFHTGQTGVGAGTRGGGGIRLKYSNPMDVDDVAVDFPDMDIILAHPSFPWQDEALSVATHKPRVHIDLSGWSPKYFPPQLVQYANSLLKDKVLFGSDFPVITPERWMKDFDAIAIKPEVRPRIMKDNAARLLGLTAVPGEK